MDIINPSRATFHSINHTHEQNKLNEILKSELKHLLKKRMDEQTEFDVEHIKFLRKQINDSTE